MGYFKKGEKILINIISLLRQSFYIAGTRRKVVSDYILDFFKENCFNDDLFCGDMVLLPNKDINNKTLFNCVVYKDIKTFGYKILVSLIEYLKKKNQKMIIIYPLSRLSYEENIYHTNSFSLLQSNFATGWSDLKKINPAINIFDPINCKIGNTEVFSKNQDKPGLWLLYFAYGDTENNMYLIKRRLRVFFSFLIAEISKTNKNIILSSLQYPSNQFFIFQENKEIRHIYINDLLHSFVGKISITKKNMENITSGLNKINTLNTEEINRFSLCADYFIKSMNGQAEDIAINQFIAIDALWGIKGNSMESTCDGILSVIGNNSKNERKAKMLYDLRCELLHGGCSTIDEWKDYDTYIKEHNEEPLDDLTNIILKKIVSYIDS